MSPLSLTTDAAESQRSKAGETPSKTILKPRSEAVNKPALPPNSTSRQSCKSSSILLPSNLPSVEEYSYIATSVFFTLLYPLQRPRFVSSPQSATTKVENNTHTLLPTSPYPSNLPAQTVNNRNTLLASFTSPACPLPFLSTPSQSTVRSPSLMQSRTPQVKLQGKAAQQGFPSTATFRTFPTRFASCTPLSTQNINHLFVNPTVNLQTFPNINHTQPFNNKHHQLHPSLLFPFHKHNTHIHAHTHPAAPH